METGRLLDGLYQIALIATLWSTGLALGASITMRDIGSVLRRTSLLARISLLDVVVIPALAWLVLRMVDLNDDLAVGVLLVASAARRAGRQPPQRMRSVAATIGSRARSRRSLRPGG
jgi:predicted Na+-dependent transporter